MLLAFWALIFGSGGLIGFLKWLRGRKPDKAIKVGDGNTTIVVNTERLTVSNSVISLASDLAVREQSEKIVGPVETEEGITEVRFGSEKGSITISKDEAPYFRLPTEEEASNDRHFPYQPLRDLLRVSVTLTCPQERVHSLS